MSAVVTPLTLAPAKGTAPNGILTGRPIKVLRVTTLNIPDQIKAVTSCSTYKLDQQETIFQRPRLGCLNKHLAIPIDSRPWNTWSISSCTFSLALTTLPTYFGLHLGGELEVPKEWKVPLGDLDICYGSSSFKGIMENGRH